MSTVNRVFELRDARGRLVRREWAPPHVAQMLGIDPDVEVEAQRLAAEQGIAPPVLQYDHQGRFMIMPFVEGQRLETDWITRPARRVAMQALLSRLRSIDASRLPRLDLPNRLRELHGRLALRSADHARSYDSDVAWCIERLEMIPDHESVLVHGDLTPENVIVRADGSLCLIDWEYAHRGQGDEDLAGLASDAPSAQEWSLAPEEFPVRVRARRLLDGLWRELATLLTD